MTILFKRCATFSIIMFLFCSATMSQNVDTSLFVPHIHIDNHDTLPYRIYRSAAATKPQTFNSFRKKAAVDDTLRALPISINPLPLIVFLHGAGERGNDNAAQLSICIPFFLDDSVANRYPYIMLCPQCPTNSRWVDTDWKLPSHQMPETPSPQMHGVFSLIDSLVASGAVDSSRIYIAGISMGGFGVFDALQRRPATFAAAIAICGGGDANYAERLTNIPLRIFHGERDRLVMPSRSRMMQEAIVDCGGDKSQLTLYPTLGHLCWNQAFSTPGLFDWLFSQSRQHSEPHHSSSK